MYIFNKSFAINITYVFFHDAPSSKAYIILDHNKQYKLDESKLTVRF